MRKTLLTIAAIVNFAAVTLAQNVPAYVPTNGLVGWYPFNGNANDESGNGNNAANFNAALIPDRFGNPNKAFNFNGSSSYLEVRDSASLRLSEGSFSFWIAYTSTSKMEIFQKINFFTAQNGNYSAEVNDYANLLSGMRPIGSYGGSCATNSILTSRFSANNGAWHHLVFVMARNKMSLYLDGVLKDTLATSGVMTPCPGGNLYIGRGWNDFPLWLNAKLDDISIYNRVLSAQEITALYTGTPTNACVANIVNNDTTICSGSRVTLTAATTSGGATGASLPANLRNGLVGYWPFNGNANDESGNGNNGTVNGATLTSDRQGVAGKAYLFDGVSNWIRVPDASSLQCKNVTLSLWFKTSATTSRYLLFKQNNNDASNENYGFEINPLAAGDHRLHGHYGNDCIPGNGWVVNEGQLPSFSDNNWHLYVGSIGRDSMISYLDGKRIVARATTDTIMKVCVGSDLLIGKGWTRFPKYFPGSLDDIAIWNRALNPAEISQLYGTTTYRWSTGDTTATINISPTQTTTYYVTISNGISSCRDSVKITVLQSTASTFTVSACNSYFWAAKNKTYTASNITDTVKLVNAAGCDSIVTLNLTINTALPGTPGSITGATDVCPAFGSPTATVSSNITYSIVPMSTASSYTWTVPTGVTLVSGQGTNSIVVNFANTFVSGAISVKANNVCGSSASARTLTVYRRAAATPAVIQKEFAPVSVPAVTNVCGVTSEIYRIRKVSYATAYNWSLSQGSKATITRLNSPGVNDTVIRVTFAAGFTRDTILVTAQTSPCSISSARTLPLNATLAPPAPTAIIAVGNFTVCVGSVHSFTALTTTPTTTQSAVQYFRWTRPLNTTITSATADSATITLRIDAGFTGGSLGVVTVSACGISSAAKSATLQYLPATPSAISASTGSLNACIGNTITYAALVSPLAATRAPSALFRWTRPANTTIISAAADSSTITLQFNSGYNGGSLSVRGQSSCGTLGSARTVTLTHTGCPSGSRVSDITGAKNNPATSWDIQLLPNPTSGSFTIQTNKFSDMPRVIMVRDMQGRLMQSFRMVNPMRSSFGSDLPSGNYIIEVWQGVEKKTVKGIKL